jgi:hypothetical protein
MDPALHEVRQAYRRGELVLFVGEGLSEAAGLPSRVELVGRLVELARARGARAEALTEIDALLKAGSAVKALSAARDAVGEQEFAVVVRKSFDDRALVKQLPELGLAIGALAPRLRTVLTTNLDELLERTFHGEWSALHRATAGMAREENVILKLHGTLRDPQTWVLTQDQYERAMYNDPQQSEGIAAIFATRPILFVGHALDDDDFAQLLGKTRALAGGQAPRHFALVPEASIAPYASKLREGAGVRLIGYPNADGRHAEVPGILRWLAEAESAAPAPPGAEARVMAFRSGSTSEAAPLPPSPDAPYDGSFYIHRGDEEERCLAKLAEPGTPIVISGPWLSGKRTLLAFLLEKIRDQEGGGKTSLVIEADLENLLPEPATPDGLLERFARHLLAETGADDAVFERLASGRQGWSDKLVELMEQHVLPTCEGRLVLIIQNADAVWGLGKVQGAFYRALRVWKERAHRPAWSMLRFILLLSTTPSLVFEDPEHANSPFANLTTDVIKIGDFTPAQLVELARMHGLDWDLDAINQHVYPLIGGHPSLTRALMYRARRRRDRLDVLVNDAAALDELFGTLLGSLGGLTKRDPHLREALEAILDNSRVPLDEDCYQRLCRAGLVSPTVNGECRIRYRLYETYLRRRWNRPAH